MKTFKQYEEQKRERPKFMEGTDLERISDDIKEILDRTLQWLALNNRTQDDFAEETARRLKYKVRDFEAAIKKDLEPSKPNWTIS